MTFCSARFISTALILTTAAALHGQAKPATDADIVKQIQSLRSLPDAQRATDTNAVALEIRALPPSPRKVVLAVGLAHLSTEGDPGHDNLQAVTTTLAQALEETPAPPNKDNSPSEPYKELAKLARYEHMTVDGAAAAAAQYTQAADALAAEDAGIEKIDFTLKDMHNKKWTLSQLRGKIVVVNFWATWCPPCRKELPDLDAIYRHYQTEGLVVFSITDEDGMKVNQFFAGQQLAFPVLLDPGKLVAKQFHVEGIPRTFVFGRDGKLASQSIDMRTQRQFLQMLASAGLKPM